MGFAPAFIVMMLSASGLAHNPASMRLIIRRPFAHLSDRLRRAFEGRNDVEVVTDRRHGERRRSNGPVPSERRRGDRRVSKEEIMEIVIQGDPLAIFH